MPLSHRHLHHHCCEGVLKGVFIRGGGRTGARVGAVGTGLAPVRDPTSPTVPSEKKEGIFYAHAFIQSYQACLVGRE